jgi:phosphate-selective porin
MQSNIKKIVAAVLSVSALASLPALADDSNIELVRALVSKGVLTEEEGALLTKGRADEMDVQKKKEKKAWTGHVNIRGYVQNRTTKVFGDEADDLSNPVDLWSDRSVGSDRSINSDKNFLIRRARVIIFGDWGDHLSYYIQPDFASSAGTTGNIAQLRDAYGDVNFDATKVHRIRVGQSKVPYGFENMQSSSNRLAMDRVDALNSAVRDERDTGAFYYYTPTHIQELFEEINKSGLKHSGNYGMLGAGFYNGQGANRGDQNDNWHFVARATYPWKTESGQIYEAGIQAYRGDYVTTTGAYRRTSTASTTPVLEGGNNGKFRNGIDDERIGVSFMMYPQPFGLQAEWNWGKTPGLDIATNTIGQESLNGGYVQAMYMLKDWNNWGTFIPFVKWQYFDGYNKAETNAPKNNVNDWELGLEWQIAPEVELMAEYHMMKRNNLVTGNRAGTRDYQSFDADALRVQLQYNF